MAPKIKPYSNYKPSSIEWLGEVPTHWEVLQLGRIGTFSKGSGGTKEDEVPEGVPCVRYGDLYTRHRFFIENTKACVSQERAIAYTPIHHGDVLFAGSGETIEEIGKSSVSLLSKPACCGGDVIIFRPSIAIDSKFLGLATDCPLAAYQKSRMGRGITVMHIYSDELKYLIVALPPLLEQTAIVRYLDYVDRRVQRLTQAKQKLVALLKEQKQVIIHRTVTRGLDPDVPMKDSGVEWLGEVPEHWEVARLKSHLSRNDSGVWGDNFSDTGTVVLRSTEQTVSGGWRINNPAKIELPPKDVESALLETGDLVVTKSSGSQIHIGKTSLVTSSIASLACCFSNFMQRLRVDGNILPVFIWYNLNSRIGREQLIFQSTTTTGLGNLNGTILANCWFSFPPLSEQTAIAKYLDKVTTDVDTAIDRTRRQVELLNEYRTRLIADVVTGKVKVPGIGHD